MRKYLAIIAVAALVAFAAPSFAATNPFIDVPLNHWAYDAIGQLAAQGILSGYPDGTYKGRQPTTRYEMASALARALAVVDMTKASRQDVEMLKRLVIEFKDELDALGFRVDQLDERVALMWSRLGGWKISGSMRMDIDFQDTDERDGSTNLSLARLFFDRWFGEDEEMHFHMRLRNENYRGGGSWAQRFWVEFPGWGDTTITVGRFNWDYLGAYNWDTGGISDAGYWSWFTDDDFDGFGISKSFGLGGFQLYLQRPSRIDAWEIAALAALQFTEQFGFDLGLHALLGDDATPGFNNQITFFGGLRFEFNDNIGLRGIYYHQTYDFDASDPDNTNAFRVGLFVNQELLGFTSLWLGYDFMEAGFMATGGGNGGFAPSDEVRAWAFNRFNYDMRTWRLGAIQQWNSQWRSWVYVAHHTFVGVRCRGNLINPAGFQWGVGVEYMLNANVGFALNYVRSDFDRQVRRWMGYRRDDHIIRFRTQITF